MTAKIFEFILLFFLLPTAFAFTRHRISAIPALWLMTAYCLAILLQDPAFDRTRLWNPGAVASSGPGILILFAIVLAVGTALILRFAPELFLSFPKSSPRLWSLVMILYPILSVYPQGIVYRAFIVQRYGSLLSAQWLLLLASAIAFSYVHIIFKNTLAVGLTFLAGLLFAARYLQTGSLVVSCFEHALYGCAIFTLGLGRSFYHGAVPR